MMKHLIFTELYGLQNSLQLAYNDWFLISDLNTSMNNIPRSGIRSCSLSIVYRLQDLIISRSRRRGQIEVILRSK